MRKLRKKLIEKTLSLDEKYLTMFILLMSSLNEGDEILTKVGKICRLNDNKFTVVVDKEVIDCSIGGLLDGFGDPVSYIFRDSEP